MKRLMLKFIRFYQRHISPHRAACCRFRPTCSAYAFEAINKYGALNGGCLSKCHPFYKGDIFDPVP